MKKNILIIVVMSIFAIFTNLGCGAEEETKASLELRFDVEHASAKNFSMVIFPKTEEEIKYVYKGKLVKESAQTIGKYKIFVDQNEEELYESQIRLYEVKFKVKNLPSNKKNQINFFKRMKNISLMVDGILAEEVAIKNNCCNENLRYVTFYPNSNQKIEMNSKLELYIAPIKDDKISQAEITLVSVKFTAKDRIVYGRQTPELGCFKKKLNPSSGPSPKTMINVNN